MDSTSAQGLRTDEPLPGLPCQEGVPAPVPVTNRVEGRRELPDGFRDWLRQSAEVPSMAAEQRRRPEGVAAQAAIDGPAIESCQHDNGGECPSNTHPQSSQRELKGYPDCQVSGGYDWLAWAACVDWLPICFEGFFLELEWAKQTCQQECKEFEWLEQIDLGPIRVMRTGLNRGGDHGQHFEFRILYRGVVIGLAKRQAAVKARPNVFVQMSGRDCLLIGAEQGYEICREFIVKLGGEIKQEQVSRADFCIDIANLPVTELQTLMEKQQFVTRSKTCKPAYELVANLKTGFSAGKWPLHLTVYDKVQELRNKCDALYQQAMIDRRWGGVQPAHATRIEFQVSRPWLVRQGVSSPNQLFRLAGSLVNKLTHDWLRLTADPVDRGNHNQQRAATAPLWIAVQDAFRQVFGEPRGELRPIQRQRIHPIRLIKQGRGCLVNAILQTGRRCLTYADIVFACAELLYVPAQRGEDLAKFMEGFRHREGEYLA